MDILIRKIIFWIIIISLAVVLFFCWLKITEERLDKFSQMKYTNLVRSIELEI